MLRRRDKKQSSLNSAHVPAAAKLPQPRRFVWGAAVWLIIAGAALRCFALVLLANQDLDPDSGHFLEDAESFSWAEPWAARYREPLWIGLVKMATAPFGYSPVALRVLSLIFSIVGLVAAWLLFKYVLPKRCALVALGLMSFNGLLIFIAPRGFRDDLIVLMFSVFCLCLFRYREEQSSKPLLVAALVSGVAAVIRWEIAVYMIAVLLFLALWKRSYRRPAAVAVLVAMLLAGPWMLANRSEYGSPFFHSIASSTWFRNSDLVDQGIEVGLLDGPPITWGEYYLDFLGPVESARRTVVGIPVLTVELLYQAVMPIRDVRLREILPASRGYGIITFLKAAAAIFAFVTASLLALGLRARGGRRFTGPAALLALGAILLYAPVSRHLEVNYRLVAFLLPLLFIVIAAGAADLTQRLSAKFEFTDPLGSHSYQ